MKKDLLQLDREVVTSDYMGGEELDTGWSEFGSGALTSVIISKLSSIPCTVSVSIVTSIVESAQETCFGTCEATCATCAGDVTCAESCQGTCNLTCDYDMLGCSAQGIC